MMMKNKANTRPAALLAGLLMRRRPALFCLWCCLLLQQQQQVVDSFTMPPLASTTSRKQTSETREAVILADNNNIMSRKKEQTRRSTGSNTALFDNNRDTCDEDMDVLNARLKELHCHNIEMEYRHPPNPNLDAQQFVRELLDALLNNDDPLPDSGFRVLLRASTKSWRQKIYESVGAPLLPPPPPASEDNNKSSSSSLKTKKSDNTTYDHYEEVVASALGDAMGRPNNQFGILVGHDESYELSFPSDPVDYDDGNCWVECQLRTNDGNDELLAVTGWQLEKINGAWMVDGIDWQDFRDAYRPGIGREEWMRICG